MEQPPAAPGELTVESRHHPTGTYVSCSGELVAATVPRLDTAIEESFRRRVEHLSLDLRQVRRIDAEGVRVLKRCATACREADVAFTLRASAAVRRTAKVLGLSQDLGLEERERIHAADDQRSVVRRLSLSGVFVFPGTRD